jgi:hypothetical protein
MITIQPTIPYNTVYPFLNNSDIFPNKLYAILCCITYILDIISPGNNFNACMKDLIKSCPLIDLHEMGFTKDWDKEEIWL